MDRNFALAIRSADIPAPREMHGRQRLKLREELVDGCWGFLVYGSSGSASGISQSTFARRVGDFRELVSDVIGATPLLVRQGSLSLQVALGFGISLVCQS